MGEKGNGNNEFNCPYIKFCNNKFVVISDCGNYCIKIFDYHGTFIKSWNGILQEELQFIII